MHLLKDGCVQAVARGVTMQRTNVKMCSSVPLQWDLHLHYSNLVALYAIGFNAGASLSVRHTTWHPGISILSLLPSQYMWQNAAV
jgi:hypothetical protein